MLCQPSVMHWCFGDTLPAFGVASMTLCRTPTAYKCVEHKADPKKDIDSKGNSSNLSWEATKISWKLNNVDRGGYWWTAATIEITMLTILYDISPWVYGLLVGKSL